MGRTRDAGVLKHHTAPRKNLRERGVRAGAVLPQPERVQHLIQGPQRKIPRPGRGNPAQGITSVTLSWGRIMGQVVLHHEGAFNLYDTISDGPVFASAITEEQLYTYIRGRHGTVGIEQLGARMERAKRKGTSSAILDSLADTLSANRAGPKESKLTTEEFISKFLTFKEST